MDATFWCFTKFDLDNFFCMRIIECVMFCQCEILPFILALVAPATHDPQFVLNYLIYMFLCYLPHAFIWQLMLFLKRDAFVLALICRRCRALSRSGELKSSLKTADQSSVEALWNTVDNENVDYFGNEPINPPPHTTHRIYNAWFNRLSVRVGWNRVSACLCPPVPSRKQASSMHRAKVIWLNNRGAILASSTCGLFCTLMAWITFNNKGQAMLFTLSLWPILFCIIWMKSRFRLFLTMLALYSFFLVLTCLIFGLGEANTTSPAGWGAGCLDMGTADSIHKTGEIPYQSCGMTKKGLDVVDYALMAKLAYRDNTTGLYNLSSEWFPEFKVVATAPPDQLMQYVQFDHRYSNVTVIAIRGTAGTWTALFDMDFYYGSTIYQYVNQLLPFSSLTPEAWVRYLIGASDVGINDLKLVEQIVTYSNSVAMTGRDLIFTGHSLGGAMAKAAALELIQYPGVSAVSFSGPGMVYVETRFSGVLRSLLDRVVWNIVPRKDIVPMADKQGGLVQQIDCDIFFVDCHGISNTIHTLVEACGDRKHRNLWCM